MLGSTLLRYFTDNDLFQVTGTARETSSVRGLPEKYLCNINFGIDIRSEDSVHKLVSNIKPDFVINCVGVVKQLPSSQDPLTILPINALFPHILSKICLDSGAKLIHFSTDCVFSGEKGMYKESDIADARDIYGLSKYLGEIKGPNLLTIRTSIIGHELNTNQSLLEWFLSQKSSVKGYRRAIFSGFPTIEIAKILENYIIPNTELSGLYHISSDPISKFELLNMTANIYDKEIDIIADDSIQIDRSLDSSLFRKTTGFHPRPWSDLLLSMHDYG